MPPRVLQPAVGGQRHRGWEPQTSSVLVPPGPSSVLVRWGAEGQQPAWLSTALAPHRPRHLQPLRCLQPLGHHHGGTLHRLLQEPHLQRVAQFQRLPVRLWVGQGWLRGRGEQGPPCPVHPCASSPLLTAHLLISAVLPQCHPATSAAAMPTCSSTSWPARPPACSQPCLPGDLCHPSEPAPPGFGHLPPRCKREVKRRDPEAAAGGGWGQPRADPRQGHPSSELRRAACGRAGPRQLRHLLVAGVWFLPWGTF